MRNRQVLWDLASVPTFWINQASRVLMRRFDEQLRPLGLSMAYLHVAVTLQEHGPLQQKALLQFVHVEQPTMAALLKRMERDGLVSRKPDPKDSRAQLVGLTARARSALVDAKDMMSKVVEQALAGISGPDRQRLIETLRLVIRNLSDDSSNLTDHAVS
jgi:MarR family transcriptional regulator for hemolysin